MQPRLSILLLAALALLSATPAARAVDRVVTKAADTNDGVCNADCSVREALDVASSGDVVVIPPGVYTVFSQLVIDTSLKLSGAGATMTILQAAATPHTAGHRVIQIEGMVDVEVCDLTIRHGSVASQGGAINVVDTVTLEIARSHIVDNEVDGDGPTGSGGSGGAIRGSGTLTIRDSVVDRNRVDARSTANNGSAGSGGAIFWGPTINVIRTSIRHNAILVSGTIAGGAGAGGAIFGGAPLTSIDSTIAHNRIDASGGSGPGGAASGGALFIDPPSVMVNSTVSGNEIIGASAASGSGIFGSGEISSSTIVYNRLPTSGPTGGGDLSGSFTLRNSILGNCSGTITSDGYNLIGDDGCSVTPSTGDQIGTVANPIDPLLYPLRYNGGPTQTHALRLDSPAVDAGNPGGCEDDESTVLTEDQRGEPREVDGDGDAVARCDIGAFELALREVGAPAVGSAWIAFALASLAALGVFRLRRRS